MNFQYPLEGFPVLYRSLVGYLMHTTPIHTGEWQAMDTSKSPAHATYELEDISIKLEELPTDMATAQELIQPDLPWAEDHFQERVSGVPHNPAPSHNWWPYAVRGNADHTFRGKFDHTYPERFWPREAGLDFSMFPAMARGVKHQFQHRGIRFEYGDLMDVAALLVRSPHTRQAYLPVWFPEDTGAVSGQRVPCTLGYHFMIRGGQLTTRYFMRSCDVYRHMVNDVYLAVRLTQWMCEKINSIVETGIEESDRSPSAPGVSDVLAQNPLVPGALVMHISSLHGFVGDRAKLEVIARGHHSR